MLRTTSWPWSSWAAFALQSAASVAIASLALPFASEIDFASSFVRSVSICSHAALPALASVSFGIFAAASRQEAVASSISDWIRDCSSPVVVELVVELVDAADEVVSPEVAAAGDEGSAENQSQCERVPRSPWGAVDRIFEGCVAGVGHGHGHLLTEVGWTRTAILDRPRSPGVPARLQFGCSARSSRPRGRARARCYFVGGAGSAGPR